MVPVMTPLNSAADHEASSHAKLNAWLNSSGRM
jgi:hypothetical protein